MAITIINVNVAYPDRFIEELKIQSQARKESGEIQYKIYFLPNTNNNLIIIADWSNYENAEKFWKSNQANSQELSWHSIDTNITIAEQLSMSTS